MRANILKRKVSPRIKGKRRTRTKISGCAVLPKIPVFKSNKTLYIQTIDDVKNITLAVVDGHKLGIEANKDGVKKIGAEFTRILETQKVEQSVFDRNDYVYHGVTTVLAKSLREDGIRL